MNTVNRVAFAAGYLTGQAARWAGARALAWWLPPLGTAAEVLEAIAEGAAERLEHASRFAHAHEHMGDNRPNVFVYTNDEEAP